MSDRLKQLQKLHAADPADPFCTYGIALEHAKAGGHDEALTWLDKTLELDESYCYAFYQKAKLLSEVDRDDEAKQVLNQGIAVAARVGDEKARSEMSDLLATLG